MSTGIKATVLADSISPAGVRMLTFEIEYPRIILAELNTHRVLSRNSASSRAIPFAKMKGQLTGKPVSFGVNQSGMQAGGEHRASVMIYNATGMSGHRGYYPHTPEEAWEKAKNEALNIAEAFSDAGYHKQVYNRLTEPFQMMKTVISGTEWGNFFWLRDDEHADPTIAALAKCMREAKDASKPQLLEAGEYHLPYVTITRRTDESMAQEFWLDNEDGVILSLEEAIKVSVARCAAVSYRNVDYGIEKAEDIFARLVGADKKHASAFEHCATPMQPSSILPGRVNCLLGAGNWEPGISHMTKDGQLWSGNLRGWIQYRKLIPGENHE